MIKLTDTQIVLDEQFHSEFPDFALPHDSFLQILRSANQKTALDCFSIVEAKPSDPLTTFEL